MRLYVKHFIMLLVCLGFLGACRSQIEPGDKNMTDWERYYDDLAKKNQQRIKLQDNPDHPLTDEELLEFHMGNSSKSIMMHMMGRTIRLGHYHNVPVVAEQKLRLI